MNKPSLAPILGIHDLRFAYPGQSALAAGWSAAIGPGVTLLHGDTGSGKTTVLRLLAATLPTTGRLTLAGVQLGEDAEAYRRHVFFCDPATADFDAVTGRACTTKLTAGDAGFNAAKWALLVEGLGLAEHIDKPMYMLSTGSKRKVWLAAALAAGRALTLLDEPTAALDGPSVRCLWHTLAGFAEATDRAVVIASSESVDRIALAATIRLPLS